MEVVDDVVDSAAAYNDEPILATEQDDSVKSETSTRAM